MNKYGEQARKWWQQLAPTDYAAMQDPEAFFTRLGEQAADEVAALTEMILERDKVPGEGKEKMRFAARLSAEEMVREEMLLPPRYVWDSDPDAEEPVDDEARQAAYWAEDDEWDAETDEMLAQGVRARRVKDELRRLGWSEERIREVDTTYDLSAPDAVETLRAYGWL